MTATTRLYNSLTFSSKQTIWLHNEYTKTRATECCQMDKTITNQNYKNNFCKTFLGENIIHNTHTAESSLVTNSAVPEVIYPDG
jgi:hypothetical protein